MNIETFYSCFMAVVLYNFIDALIKVFMDRKK